jgi:arylsulfatase A-like enzyme
VYRTGPVADESCKLSVHQKEAEQKPALIRYALCGSAACFLLSLIELSDLNFQLAPVFESALNRLIFAAYFSLNILSGLAIGSVVGLIALVASRVKSAAEKKLARGLIINLSLCLIAALALNQLPPAHRFAIALIREAEKIEPLTAPLLNHERSASYLILMSLAVGCWIASAIARACKHPRPLLRLGVILILIILILSAYYIDSRVEVQLYEYSLHRSMFLLNLVLAMTLVAAIYFSSPRLQALHLRLLPAAVASLALISLVVFTFVHFDRDQNLKTQLFYRTTQAKQHFKLIQWVLDFDRDGYSALLGGGDADDRRSDINPGQTEIVGDQIDNNCIGGDLTWEDIDDWYRTLQSLHAFPAASAQRFNLIYIFIDALRADHLGAYGYQKNTSPNIDKLAAKAFIFENAYTPAPNTFEALPKFMQSNYWDAHLPSWSELLARSGYNTLLFPRRIATLLRHVKGMSVAPRSPDGSFGGTIDVAIEVLGSTSAERPFCAFLYATDPHLPYRKHEGFDFGTTSSDHYDSEIAYVDFHLGRLFDWLEKSGKMDKTMIVIMADHGESLGERSVYRHSTQLYNEQSHIPLIIYVPGLAPRRIPDYVSSIDLGATILNTVGIEYPKECAGVSLLALMRGEHFLHPPIYGEQTGEEDSPFVQPNQNVNPKSKKYMVITQDGYKLIYNRNYYCFELFDLKRDPKEEHNLYDRMPEKAAEMKRLLGRFIDILQVSRPADADESQYFFGPTIPAKQEQ